jgi:hypothetical protein
VTVREVRAGVRAIPNQEARGMAATQERGDGGMDFLGPG